MTSFRQFEANRRNALRSTGPKSDDGKRQSRINAVRHGLTAETVGFEQTRLVRIGGATQWVSVQRRVWEDSRLARSSQPETLLCNYRSG